MKPLSSRPIKEYCIGIYDGPHATPRESADGPVFLGIKNLTEDGRIDLSEIRHVSEEEFPKWTRRVTPQRGDVVFTYEATLHRYAMIPEGFRGCLGRRIALVRPDINKVDHRFLLYYFLSHSWRNIVEANVITGATVDRVPLERFPDFPASLPTLPVQHRIADILSAYDDLIENNRRRMALLEEAAGQVYREWFVRLRFPGHEHARIANGLPEGWEECCIHEFGEVVTGKTPSTKESDNYGGEILFIKTPDMRGNVFVIETETRLTEKGANTQPGKFIPTNAVLVSCIGTIGVVSITSAHSQFNQQINAVVPFEDAYLYYCFFAFKDLKESMEAIGGGATMGNVNKKKFEKLKVLKPLMPLLRDFHEFCNPLFQQIQVLSFQNQWLRAARDLLLPRLMSGEIVV